MYNFRSLSNNFTTIFWSLIFQILLPDWAIFRKKEETENFRIKKRDGERNQKNCHFCNTLNSI